MSTAAQIDANRANAQLSTGPVTAAGKETSSRNALRHGLYAKSPIIPGESPTDYSNLRDQIIAEFHPHSAEQLLLCEQLIDAIWRDRRVERLETAWLTRNPDPDLADPKLFRLWSEFARQHNRHQRAIFQALKRLNQLRPPELAPFRSSRAIEAPVAPDPPAYDRRTLGRPRPALPRAA